MNRSCIIIAVMLMLVACGSSSKKENPQPASTTPAQVSLTSPEQNSICVLGTIISNTQSSVLFIWNASANTDSYDLVIENLLTTTTTTQSTTQAELAVTLNRNTPYSWYVISKSIKTASTTESDTWKFYNSGPGVVTYAPFPADITVPVLGAVVTTSTVNLTWTGNIVTGGSAIANYDVYFGTTTTPPILKSAITDSFVNGVSVNSNTTYYWKVITRDINGNISDSGLYQFTVN